MEGYAIGGRPGNVATAERAAKASQKNIAESNKMPLTMSRRLIILLTLHIVINLLK